MEVAIAGCGSVASRYAGGLADADHLDLVAVADPVSERAASLADATGSEAYHGLGAMLDRADPDLVVNLTSHREHAPVTRECLEAGVHVYSEKPLALEADEAQSLLEVAESAGLGLGCAPINHRAEHQRLAAGRLADGSLGAVRVVSATAHVGRVTEWHDRPGSFLEVGPLYDGGVYPLTLLVEWFGPVTAVRTADASHPYPEREAAEPSAPTHVDATLELEAGPQVRLTASYYVPHRAREFYGVEVHGDYGSLYLADTGDLGGSREPLVSVGGAGRGYTPVPLQRKPTETPHIAGVVSLAEAVRRGETATASARRAAHVVTACAAIEIAAETGERVTVAPCGVEPSGPAELARGPPRTAPSAGDGPPAAMVLPPVGFGCSRYRDGEYVDRIASIETALDAGYRLLDSAELYGNESRIGELLAAPGSPDREALCLVSKVWNTNHGHVREACESTLDALGIETLDAYLLHWPEAWAYTGSLRDLASLPPEEAEARTFPRDDDGEPVPGDASLEDAWRGLEAVRDAGLTRHIGVCNVDRETLEVILEVGEVPPAIVQVERHPYQPQRPLVSFCRDRGIQVMAHSPLSAPGLLEEPAITDVAEGRGISPAQAVLAWNVGDGVVPIPSSVDPDHVVENAAAAGVRLDEAERRRIDGLADPSFER